MGFYIFGLAIVFDFLWEKTPARKCIGWKNIVKDNLLLLMAFINSRGEHYIHVVFSLFIYLISGPGCSKPD